MKFPRFVYISPGLNECLGGSFNAELVENETDFNAAIKAGFSDSVPAALEACKIKMESMKKGSLKIPKKA